MVKTNILALVLLLITALESLSQDTLYFKFNRETSGKDSANYYRVFKDTINLFLVKDYFMSGKIKMISLSTSKDPINKIGMVKTFHENGIVYTMCYYKANKLEGHYTEFNENGNKSSEGEYYNGEMTGNWVYYHNNGNVQSRFVLKNGLGNGLAEFYYEDGSIHRKGKYIDDKIAGKWITYNKAGRNEKVTKYKYKLAVPTVKQKLRFTQNRWSIIDKATDGNFLRVVYLGTGLKGQTSKHSIPPRIHIFISENNGETIQENYSRVLSRLKIEESSSYSFPQRLPDAFSDVRTFYMEVPKGYVSKWTSVCFQSSAKKQLIMLFEVEDKFWADQVKVFNEILLSFK